MFIPVPGTELLKIPKWWEIKVLLAIYNKSLSTTSVFMLMTNFWKAPKDEDWLPREPTKQLEDGTQPSCPHLQGGGGG